MMFRSASLVIALITFQLISPAFSLFAQTGSAAALTLTGKLNDANTALPLGYATVTLFSAADSSAVTGALTDERGAFTLNAPAGAYYARLEYLGYKPHYVPGIQLSADKSPLRLATIALQQSSTTLEEVVVQAEKSSMQLTLDKKVFNVGKDLGNAGGTASDILSNIPSIQVGSDGAVSLRGSENVRILIDGKPSGLLSFKGAEGLQQLQGSMIEKVEIITNPSARYEAEGMGGIINIVLKKERTQGLNGSFDVTLGYPQNYGVGINLNYRTKKLNFFANYSPSYRNTPNSSSYTQSVFNGDTTFLTKQTSNNRQKAWNNNLRLGADYFFSPKNTLTTSFSYNHSQSRRLADLEYRDFLFSENNPTGITARTQDETETEPNLEYALNYKRTFSRQGHELTAELRYLDNWENSDQLFTEKYYLPDGSNTGKVDLLQQSLNYETEKQYLLQLDYVQPFGKDGKFEAGLRSTFRDMTNDYVVQENIDNVWYPLAGLDNNFLYNEDIHAAYVILGNKYKKFSYQFGLRAENSAVTTTLLETNEVNDRNYTNLFPSTHFTYELPGQNAVQISFSRRIRRPRYNDLSPFFTYTDSRNYWSGNPDLEPEYTNSFELGHVKYFDNASLSSSLYYRHTDGKVERIRRVDALGNSATRPENLSTEDAFGAEFTAIYSPWKWWKLDGNVNFFRSIIDDGVDGEVYESDTYTWFSRLTNRFTLWKKTDLQLRGNYEAPRLTPQGERKAIAFLDLGISRDVFGDNGTLTLNLSDVFNSRRWRNITEGDNFYSEGNFQRRPRQINLSLNYRLHQSKKKPPVNEGEDF